MLPAVVAGVGVSVQGVFDQGGFLPGGCLPRGICQDEVSVRHTLPLEQND